MVIGSNRLLGLLLRRFERLWRLAHQRALYAGQCSESQGHDGEEDEESDEETGNDTRGEELVAFEDAAFWGWRGGFRCINEFGIGAKEGADGWAWVGWKLAERVAVWRS